MGLREAADSVRVTRTLEIDDLIRAGNAGRLAQLLEHDVLEPKAREFAVAGLGRLRAHEYVPLLERLFAGSDEGTRLSVVISLKQIASPASVPTLVRALGDLDKIAWVAADALGRIGDKRASGPLGDLLRRGHSHRWVRRCAAEALARVGGADAAQALNEAAAGERHPLHRRRMRKLAKQTIP